MSIIQWPHLRFVGEFTEQDAYEAQGRGYLSHVLVELDSGRLYPVSFYDPMRLGQDLEQLAGLGRPFLAEPGMIVVPEITPESMKTAVERLAGDGFFDHLSPITLDDLKSSPPHAWPPRPGVGSQSTTVPALTPIPGPIPGNTGTPAGPPR
jgi:hypothetical protein